MSCIYKITNIKNNKVYIGLSTKSAEKRFKEHISNSKSKKFLISALWRAIRKYGKDNFKHEVIVSGDFNREQLSNLEREYITVYNSLIENGKGYNLDKGGFYNDRLTEESKKRISEKLKGHTCTFKGKKRSLEFRENVRQANYKLYENGYINPCKRKVYQYNLKGELINKFDSITEASKLLNISKWTIQNSNKNSSKTRLGFLFKILKEDSNAQSL